MLNKKGLHVETTVVLILFLLVVVFLGVAQSNIFKTTTSAVDREACADSIIFKARSKLGLISSPVDIKCNTNKIEIKTKNLDEIKKTIAEEFALCAKQFHIGQIDFLSELDFHPGKDVFCFICSNIEFSEEVKEKHPKIEIREYLNTEKIINGKTVAHFISNDPEFKFTGEQVASIDTSKNLYALFYALKYNTWGEKIGWSTATAGGVTIAFSITGGTFGLLGGLPGAISGAVLGAKIGAVVGTIAGIGEIATDTGVKPEYLPGFLLVSGEGVEKECTELIA